MDPEDLSDAELQAEIDLATQDDDPLTGYGSERQIALRREAIRRSTDPGRTEPADWQVPTGDVAGLLDAELADALANVDPDDSRAEELRAEAQRRQDTQDTATVDALLAGVENQPQGLRDKARAQAEQHRDTLEKARRQRDRESAQ